MKLSIVITAHDRKRFLPYAIKSVINNDETIPEEIEIVVVKNFYDKEIDNALNKLGVINVYSEDKSLSIKQYQGIKKSSGDVIAFLEDDDMFSKNKTKVLLDVFSRFDIDFFHNNIVQINENTQESFNVNFDEKMLKIINTNEIVRRKVIKRIIHVYHPELYNSCIAVSKSLALTCLDGLKLADINTERFWFLCAIENKKSIALTNSQLTLYRIHSESYSQPRSKLFEEFKTNLLDRYLASYMSMLKYFNDQNVRKLIYEMMILHKAHKLLFEPDSILDKTKALIDLLKISINPYSTYNKYSLFTAFSLLMSVFDQKTAIKIFYR